MTVIMATDQTEVDPSGRVTEKSKPPRKILVTNWEPVLKIPQLQSWNPDSATSWIHKSMYGFRSLTLISESIAP
jgi:hypothetical protein